MLSSHYYVENTEGYNKQGQAKLIIGKSLWNGGKSDTFWFYTARMLRRSNGVAVGTAVRLCMRSCIPRIVNLNNREWLKPFARRKMESLTWDWGWPFPIGSNKWTSCCAIRTDDVRHQSLADAAWTWSLRESARLQDPRCATEDTPPQAT